MSRTGRGKLVNESACGDGSSSGSARIAVALVACLPLAVIWTARAQIPCRYEVAHIIQGPPCTSGGNSITIGAAISPNGRYVVGRYRQCGFSEDRAFIYDTTTQQFSLIPMPAGIYAASAEDVSDVGVIVGTSLRTNIGQRGFMYRIDNGQWMEFPPLPGGVWSGATGVNSSGTVCGWRSIGPGTLPQTAFIWTPQGGFTDLGLVNGQSTIGWDISDAGKLVGQVGLDTLSSTVRAFLFDNGGTTVLPAVPGGINSFTRVVAPSGEVPVTGLLEPPPVVLSRLFMYEGDFQMLRVPPGCDRTGSNGMNAHNIIAGSCSDLATGTSRGVAWYGDSPRVLNSMIDITSDIYLSNAADISEAGAIVCNGYYKTCCSNDLAFYLSPVPRMVGDTDCDEHVNINDLLNVIGAWGPCTSCESDLNGDGIVNVQDLMIVLVHWSF